MFLITLERKVQISCIFCGFICGGCGFYDDFILTCSFFYWVCCFLVRKKEQAIYEMYKYVVCINVWVCMICFSVWRWRDYIISISSCLSCCLVSCWMMSCYQVERKVQINWFLWGILCNYVSLLTLVVMVHNNL